jgi:hypothetical protein
MGATQETTNRINQSNRAPREKFTAEEDTILINFAKKYGIDTWKYINNFLPNRAPRQFRERYKNYLSPNVENRSWTNEEEE